MLSCIVGNKGVNTFQHSKEKLRKWSDKKILKCPECGERVIYCHGEFKVPYFKHEAKSDCSGAYAEAYTDEHIDGIRLIYNWLKTLDNVKNLEVEKYIKNTKQRPDIYFEIDDNRYCIEFQCSPIATKYKERSELYYLEGIRDIWILGMNKYQICQLKNKLIDPCGEVLVEEYKAKTIEREINDGASPLIYLDNDDSKLYKVNKYGFEPVYRKSSYGYNGVVLKTVFKIGFIGWEMDKCTESILFSKDNLSKLEILDIINKNKETVTDGVNKLNDLCDFLYYKVEYIHSQNGDVVAKMIRSTDNNFSNWFKLEDISKTMSLESMVMRLEGIIASEKAYIKNKEEERAKKLEFDDKIKTLSSSESLKKMINKINSKLSLINNSYNVYSRIGWYGAYLSFNFGTTRLFELNILNLEMSEIEIQINKNIDDYIKNINRIKEVEKIKEVICELSSNLKLINKIKTKTYRGYCFYSSELDEIKLKSEEIIETRLNCGGEIFYIKITNSSIRMYSRQGVDSTVEYDSIVNFRSKLVKMVTDNIRKVRYPKYDL